MVKYSKVRKKEKLTAAEQVDFNEVCGELQYKVQDQCHSSESARARSYLRVWL